MAHVCSFFFQDVPAGVSVFSNVSVDIGSDVVRMVAPGPGGEGPFSPVAGNPSGIAPIPLARGSGIAVFEAVEAAFNSFAVIDIPFHAAYDSTVGLPSLSVATASTALAPLSLAASADATSPEPRFGFVSTASNVFAASACACATYMSAPVTVTRGGFSSFASDPSRAPAGGGSVITMDAPQINVDAPEPGYFVLTGIALVALKLIRRRSAR